MFLNSNGSVDYKTRVLEYLTDLDERSQLQLQFNRIAVSLYHLFKKKRE